MQEKGRKNFRAPTSRRPPHKTPPKNKRAFPHVIADDVLAKKIRKNRTCACVYQKNVVPLQPNCVFTLRKDEQKGQTLFG